MSNRQYIVTGQKIDPAKLEQAKALRRNMTPAERRLWAALRNHRLNGFHFRRQQVIDGFIADFYCHASGLVVEVDGPVHEGQAEYDAERDRILAARGLQILRFRNEEIMDRLENVLERIRSACHRWVNPLPNLSTTQDNSPPRFGEGPGVGSSPPRFGEGPGVGSSPSCFGEGSGPAEGGTQ